VPERPIIVFDVNETLLDLDAIQPVFDRIFDDPAAMRLWFAGLITYSEALTLAGVYVPFTDIGGAVLRMLAATRPPAGTARLPRGTRADQMARRRRRRVLCRYRSHRYRGERLGPQHDFLRVRVRLQRGYPHRELRIRASRSRRRRRRLRQRHSSRAGSARAPA
jgi:hypothetical protein